MVIRKNSQGNQKVTKLKIIYYDYKVRDGKNMLRLKVKFNYFLHFKQNFILRISKFKADT